MEREAKLESMTLDPSSSQQVSNCITLFVISQSYIDVLLSQEAHDHLVIGHDICTKIHRLQKSQRCERVICAVSVAD